MKSYRNECNEMKPGQRERAAQLEVVQNDSVYQFIAHYKRCYNQLNRPTLDCGGYDLPTSTNEVWRGRFGK